MALISFLIIFLNLINNSYHYLIIPFKLFNSQPNLNDNEIDIENFILEINKNQIYSGISFGTPQLNLKVFYTMEQTFSGIFSNYCPKQSNSSYNPFDSSSYKNSTPFNIKVRSIINASLSTDIFSLYNDIQFKSKQNMENFEFLIGKLDKYNEKDVELNTYCGMLGLLIKSNQGYLYNENFMRHLKKEKIINSYSWGLFFFDKEGSYKIKDEIKNNYDGFYIVGFNETDYSVLFQFSEVINTYYIENKTFNGLGINFDEIYFYESPKNITKYIINSKNTLVELYLDNNFIFSNSIYFKNIKEIFLENISKVIFVLRKILI